MADIHGSPADGAQNPQNQGPGSAPVPYGGARPSEPPGYGVSLDLTDAAAEVMSGVSGPTVLESSAAHDIAAGLADAPYSPGQPQPVFTGGDADAGGQDDVAGSVQAAVDAATARWHELQGDLGQGGVIGDLVTFPPGPLDPGAGVGNTSPLGGFYDPPREYT